MKFIKIIIPGKPTALKRPRFWNNRAFDSQKPLKKATIGLIQNAIKKTNQQERILKAFDCALDVRLVFVHRMPHQAAKGKQNAILWGFESIKTIPTKCDIDNQIKFILDVGNKILWNDDRQIVRLSAHKRYGPKPQTEITIMALELTLAQKVLSCVNPSIIESLKERLENIIASGFAESHIAEFVAHLAENHASELQKIAKEHPDASSQLKDCLQAVEKSVEEPQKEAE